jgi:phage I-like protein
MGDAHSAVLGAGQVVALNARGAAPDWVMLTPKGPRIVGNDGRVFILDNPSAVVDAFAKSGLKLPIDINHAQFHKAPKGEASTAVGWIEQLEARDGAIWGRVEWNSCGAGALKDRDYRYISPALKLDAAGRVVGIAHAGLVNEPNFAMPALNARSEASEQSALLREIMERCGHKVPSAT